MEKFYDLELLCHAAVLEERFGLVSRRKRINSSLDTTFEENKEEQIICVDDDGDNEEDKSILGKRKYDQDDNQSEKRRIVQDRTESSRVETLNKTCEDDSKPSKKWWFMRVLDAANGGIPFKSNSNSKKMSIDEEDRPVEEVITPSKPKQLAVYTPIITMNWLTHLEELKEFKKQYGHCNVSRKNMQWKSLGHCVRQQRRKKKNGKLNDTQIDLLDKMGFEWDRSYYLYSKVPHRDALKELPVQLLHKRQKEEEARKAANVSSIVTRAAAEALNLAQKEGTDKPNSVPETKKASSVLGRITRNSALARSL